MFKKTYAAAGILCLGMILVGFAGCSLKFLKKDGFVVFYSNDIRGEFENCGCADVQLGGLARKARVLREAAQKDPEMLRLDAGNLFFQKQPASPLEAGEFLVKAGYILKAYAAMGCDALNVGDSDLLLGLAALQDLRSSSPIAFVSANILSRDSGKPLFEPVVFKTVAGTRVAISGVCPQDTAFIPELQIADPAGATRAILSQARGRSDFFILLSSLGLERDRELARQVPGINLIISAGAERFQEKAIEQSGTLIVQAYNRGQYLGKISVERGGSGYGLSHRLIALEPRIGEEKAIADLGNAYKAEITATNKQAFFNSQLQQSGQGQAAYAGSDSCVECHAAQHDGWQATPHAHAYETLVKDNAQYRAECLVCHTTGYGQPGGYEPATQKKQSAMINVQCEACHGPGGSHTGNKKNILRDGGKELCLSCHTEKNSPKFDYEQYLPLVKCPAGGKK